MDNYYLAGFVAVVAYLIGALVNARAREVKDKIDLVMRELDGLRQYLYEIDPQFDDERESSAAFERRDDIFAGYDDIKLQERKERDGRRTLRTPFSGD